MLHWLHLFLLLSRASRRPVSLLVPSLLPLPQLIQGDIGIKCECKDDEYDNWDTSVWNGDESENNDPDLLVAFLLVVKCWCDNPEY